MPNTELVEKSVDVAVTSSLPEAPNNLENGNKNACENCHQALEGPFCGQCGQNSESTLKYFWVVIMHLLDDIFSFDSRALRTLFPLLTRPGFLTNEYFAGRRVHYVPPLRLYLFISIVFFITLQFFVTAENSNVLKVNDNQSVITEIKEHIVLLEEKQLNARENKDENTVDNTGKSIGETTVENSDELLKISSELSRFTTLLDDINKDPTIEENLNLIKMSRVLAELELANIYDDKPIKGRDKDRYDAMTSNIAKIKNGEEVAITKRPITFGNKPDGSLSFDFLSEDSNKKLNDFTETLIQKAEKAFLSDTTPLVQEAIGKLPQLMFILLPIFALLLKVMFLFSKRLYMEHLTVALHSHSFIFFTVLLLELLDVFEDYSKTAFPSITFSIHMIAIAFIVWIPIYLFIMQKRVYKQGYFFTTTKFILIGTTYLVLISFTGVIAFIWGLTDV